MSVFTNVAQLLSSKDINVPNGTADQVLASGLNLAYLIAGIIAVIVIIIAGFMIVTNGGEPETVKKARNSILYAVIGLVVIMIAFTVTWFVVGRF
jgi:Na+-driven multidrug efflux pump